METANTFKELSHFKHQEMMKHFENLPYEKRSYLSVLVTTAYMEGLRTGYWKGMDDAKAVMFINHKNKCLIDFDYWVKHHVKIHDSHDSD